ncbi:hypothetical protein OCL94_02045 [Macrococcus sp. TMW 2.2395]|nr:hypothetical protein [Macrococcus sp. TMW 2.2395]
MIDINGSTTKYYVLQTIASDGVDTDGELTRALYYNAYDRVYSPVDKLDYATSYDNVKDAEVRRDKLNLLASLDEDTSVSVTYKVMQRTSTNSIVDQA